MLWVSMRRLRAWLAAWQSPSLDEGPFRKMGCEDAAWYAEQPKAPATFKAASTAVLNPFAWSSQMCSARALKRTLPSPSGSVPSQTHPPEEDGTALPTMIKMSAAPPPRGIDAAAPHMA